MSSLTISKLRFVEHLVHIFKISFIEKLFPATTLSLCASTTNKNPPLNSASPISEKCIPIWCNTLLENIHTGLKVVFQDVDLLLHWIIHLQSYFQSLRNECELFYRILYSLKLVYELIGPLLQSCVLGFI